MGALDIFRSDSSKFEDRLARFERVSPLFDEAKDAYAILEKDYPEYVTPELKDLFARVGKKVEDERWYVGTWQPKGEELSLPESIGQQETTPLSSPLPRGETSSVDGERGELGKAVDAVMNGQEPVQQGEIGMLEAFGDEISGMEGMKKIPFVGGAYGVAEALDLIGAIKRLDEGDYEQFQQAPKYKITSMGGYVRDFQDVFTKERDLKLLGDYFIDLDEKQRRGYTFWGKFAKGISVLPTYMIEFMLTGGLATLGKTAAKEAAFRVLKSHVKTKAGRAALKAAGWTGGAISRASLGLPTRVAEKTATRQAMSALDLAEKESWATSFAKGWGDEVIEAASETAGGAITKAVAFPLKKIVGKTKLGTQLLGGIQKAWQKVTGGSSGEFTKKLLEKGGYSNIIGEIGEERLGTVLRAITDVDDFGAGEDANVLERLEAGLKQDLENIGVEAAVLSVPTAARVTAGTLSKEKKITEPVKKKYTEGPRKIKIPEETKEYATKAKEGERVREAEKEVPEGRVLRGEGEGTGKKGLQQEYGKDRLGEIDRKRIAFDKMEFVKREFVKRYLRYREQVKAQAKVEKKEITTKPQKTKRKPSYRGKNEIKIEGDERLMFAAEFGNLKEGRVIPGGLKERDVVGDQGDVYKEVTGRFPSSSTNPDWYRDSAVLQNYGKNRILPVMNKVLKGIPLTDKQVKIYNEVRGAIDDYAFKVVNEYMPKIEKEQVKVKAEIKKDKESEFDEAISAGEVKKTGFEPSAVKGEKDTVFYEDLKEGDRFTINGESFEVKSKDRGVMKVEDGKTYTLEPDFSPLDVDRGSIHLKGAKAQRKDVEKEPYEMTQSQFRNTKRKGSESLPLPEVKKIHAQHKESVKQAIADDKPVSPEVLKDYPDLQKDSGEKPAIKVEKTDVDRLVDKYIDSERKPGEGSWEGSATRNYAETFVRKALNTFRKKPWINSSYLEKVPPFRNMRAEGKRSASNLIQKLSKKDILQVAWNDYGTPFYALPGEKIPSNYMSNEIYSKLAEKAKGKPEAEQDKIFADWFKKDKGLKIDKTEAGDQVSFRTEAEATIPRGKKKVKPGQKKLEQQEGGLFERERPKGKQETIFEDRGGYRVRSEISEYDYGRPGLVEMPEMVEIVNAINEGKFPKIVEWFKRKPGMVGELRAFEGDKAELGLRADIFIGHHRKQQKFYRKPAFDEAFKLKYAKELNIPLESLRFKWRYKNNRHVLDVYEFDPTLAGRVFAHEIGHLVDFVPEKTTKRGNILGRIASLKKYMDTLLEAFPGAPGKKLDKADRERLKKEARNLVGDTKEIWIDKEIHIELDPIKPKDILAVWQDTEAAIKEPELNRYVAGLSSSQKKSIVKEALKGKIPDWFGFKRHVKTVIEKIKKQVPIYDREAEVQAKWRELIKEEIKKRRLFEADEIMEELKKVSKIWKPFDEKRDAGYTRYRFSSEELYADAFSVLLNDPGMVKDTAPSFYKAFFNYFERKPEVKKVWEEIQGRIKGDLGEVYEERGGRIRDMFAHEEDIYREMNKPEKFRKTVRTGFLELKKIFIDQEAALQAKVKVKGKGKKKGDDPRYWVEELPYVSSKVYQVLRDVENDLLKSMKKHGLTRDDLGELMFLSRVKGERAEYANPLGFTEKAATAQMRHLKKKLGDKKYQALIDFANEFRAIRERSVIPVIEDAKLVGEELLKTIKDTKEYATFNVLKYMEKRYGKSVGAKIYRQVGTLQEIGNPFMATVMKDMALIRAAERKKIAEQFVEFMKKNLPKDIQEAKFRIERDKDGNTRRVPAEPKDPELGLVVFPELGKLKGYYVEKDIAETFNRDPYEAGIIYNAWQNVLAPFRAIFVAKNPFWSIWNTQRDIRRGATLLPKANMMRMMSNMVRSVPDTYKDVFQKYSTDLVREMYENKMLLVGRHYRSKYKADSETDFDMMMQSFSLNEPKYKNVFMKGLNGVLEALEKPGQFSERLTKIASYRHLKGKLPKEHIKRQAHLVRTRGGSPDFYRRGTGFRFYNNIWLFSNAGKEGWRGSFEAARENPGAFAYKTFKYDILPKTLMYAAAVGGITALGKSLGDEGLEEQGKWLEEAYKRIPEHDKTNYLCIPFGFTKNGKVVYAVAPHDFTGQVIAGVYWKLMNQKKTGDLSGLADFVAGGLPYESLSPPISIALDWYSYLRGKNPNDPWMNRPMIEDTKWEAGGKVRGSEMMRQTWNRYGGRQFYSFPYDDLDKIKSDLEKAIGKPVVAGFVRRFLRVSDRGTYDEMLDSADFKGEEKRAARESLKRREAIINHLNKGVITSRADAAQLWKSLKGTGMDMGSFGTFFNQYVKYVGRKKGDVIFNVLQAAQTNAKRRIILEKLLERPVDIREVPGIWKRMKYETLKK